MYIDQELVDFRREYPSMISAREAMQRKQEDMRASGIGFTGFYHLGPILVCEQGARLRNLDLEVAAADAKYWWETGKVPLRATPTVKKPQRGLGKKSPARPSWGKSREKKAKLEKVRCVRCGALETKSKATHLAQGWVCEKCDRGLTQDIMRDMMRP